MIYAEFLKFISKIGDEKLLSIEAHKKMAPLERLDSLKSNYIPIDAKKSAVMMLFYPKNGITHFVLMKRNTYSGVHSSQISFPGGKYELEDFDLKETALRETYEEIGILPDKIEIIMPFSEIYIPPSNFLVMPFLGIAKEELFFSANPKEVAALIEVPIDVFLDDSIIVNIDMKTSYSEKIVVPAFKIEDYIVWGATAMILSELKETIKSLMK